MKYILEESTPLNNDDVCLLCPNNEDECTRCMKLNIYDALNTAKRVGLDLTIFEEDLQTNNLTSQLSQGPFQRKWARRRL